MRLSVDTYCQYFLQGLDLVFDSSCNIETHIYLIRHGIAAAAYPKIPSIYSEFPLKLISS